MKIMKKTLSFILSLVLVFSAVLPVVSIKANAAGKWVSTWATSIVDSSISVASLNVQDLIPARSTIRIELKVTTGGESLRFKFSNEYGKAAITIGEATVAKTKGEGDADIVASTAKGLTFDGEKKVTIQRGETVWSDPVAFRTQALDALSVSLYFEGTTYITSAGLSNARTFLGLRSIFREDVSQCYAEDIASSREVNIGSGTITYHTTPFLSCIDTYVPEGNTDVAVFIGDSTLVNDTYLYFAEKLLKGGVENISVINQAVIGNKLLSDGTGVIGNLYGKALIDRFQRDALSVDGVKYVFVKIGLNDILHQFSKSMGSAVPHYTAKDIIAGYEKLVKMAHAQGVKIYFFTKSPWKGYEREFLGQTGDVIWNQQMQNMCDELDKWIKTNKVADGYIDCSPLQNPADKYALCPSFTPDGAHLTPIASIALADLIPVSFVGANNKMKTVAELYNIDPYKEKKQIIYDLEHPTEAPTQKPAQNNQNNGGNNSNNDPGASEEPATQAPSEVTTTTPNVIVPGNTVTTLPQETTTLPTYIPPENITVPVLGQNGNNSQGGDSPNYSVPDTIGDGVPIAFILVLFLVITVAAAVVFLTLGRKKEEFA